jgi:hypothetical protein
MCDLHSLYLYNPEKWPFYGNISIKREKESKIRLEIKEKNYFCENNDKKTRKRENVPFS